tara:strand:+ start:4084 stop:4233 length:150 start_codon:yes stop_codon:yes gene_type:complete
MSVFLQTVITDLQDKLTPANQAFFKKGMNPKKFAMNLENSAIIKALLFP